MRGTRRGYSRDNDGESSVGTGYTEMSGFTGVTSRTGTVTAGPGGNFIRINKLVLFWTTAMTLTVLTILSFFTCALISIGTGDSDRRSRYMYRSLEDGGGGDDDAVVAGNDDAAAEGDDQDQQDGDDAAAAVADDDQWGADNYEIGDDDQAYGVVDDAIAADGSKFSWRGDMDGFNFLLSWQEVTYLVIILFSVIVLDYYGLEALKELGNKAARFRIGAFAAFVLFLGNATAACAFLLGVVKSNDDVGGGIQGTPVNAVSVLFTILSILYLGFGTTLFGAERTPLISSKKREPILEASKGSTVTNMFRFWILLVIAVIFLHLAAYLMQQEAQKAQQHQYHYKLNVAFAWSVGAFTIIFFVGTIALKARGYSTKLLTGSFFGSLAGYALLCLTFAIYFINARNKKDYQGRITTGETAFAVVSLFIAVVSALYSRAVFTYRHAIIKVNASDSGLPMAVPPTTSHALFT